MEKKTLHAMVEVTVKKGLLKRDFLQVVARCHHVLFDDGSFRLLRDRWGDYVKDLPKSHSHRDSVYLSEWIQSSWKDPNDVSWCSTSEFVQSDAVRDIVQRVVQRCEYEIGNQQHSTTDSSSGDTGSGEGKAD